MNPVRLLVSVLGCAALLPAAAQPAAAPEAAALAGMAPYRPQEQVTGTLRLWGHGSTKIDFMGRLVRAWEADFNRFQPGVRFDYRMYGTASAIGALYTGAGDIALMGEEIFPFESRAYEKARHGPPASVEIATGSLDVRNFDFAQMVFVNRDNPLSGLTLAQLDAVFGTEHRRGEPRNFRTWGDLGLTGEWADQPIHLYGWAFDNDFWIYLQQAVFGGSHRWNNSMREYAHIPRPDGTIYDAGQQILEALAKDRYGLALSNRRYLNPGVKALALAARAGGPYFAATKETMINREYPLTRIIPAVYNRAPGERLEPAVREFLRYLVSREGQAVVVRDAEYLPLNPAAAREQLAKLDDGPPGAAVAPPPPAPPAGALRIAGDDRLGPVIQLWERDFAALHPEARFANDLLGTSTGMAGLYSGTADLAFLGRRIDPVETMAFAWVFRYQPLGIDVATGSLTTPGDAPALVAFVHAGNPLERLTLAQLDGLFGCEHRRGPANLRTWGDLGLTGPRAGRPVHLYFYDVESGRAIFFRDTVLQGSRKWNWDELKEFAGGRKADGSRRDPDQEILAALAADPDGLAVANLEPVAGVKPLALATDPAGPDSAPTEANLRAGSYPLARTVAAYVNRPPGQPVPPLLRKFLEFILSPAGQGDLDRAGDFLPLAPPRIQAGLRTLQ